MPLPPASRSDFKQIVAMLSAFVIVVIIIDAVASCEPSPAAPAKYAVGDVLQHKLTSEQVVVLKVCYQSKYYCVHATGGFVGSGDHLLTATNNLKTMLREHKNAENKTTEQDGDALARLVSYK